MEKDEIQKIYEKYKAEIEAATIDQKMPHNVINEFQEVELPENDRQDSRYLYQKNISKNLMVDGV